METRGKVGPFSWSVSGTRLANKRWILSNVEPRSISPCVHRSTSYLVTSSAWFRCCLFEPLKDPAFFAQVSIDHGTVVWPNGLDLDPLVLHGDFKPAALRSEHRIG